MAAFADKTRNVSRRHVRQAADDARYSLPPTKRFGAPLLTGLGVVCGVAGLSMIAWHFLRADSAQPVQTHAVAAATPAAASTVLSAPPSPAPQVVITPTTAASTPAAQRVASPASPGLGVIASALLDESHAHIAQSPPASYFVQLQRVSAADAPSLEAFLQRTRQSLDPAQLRLYQATVDGRIRYGVIFGDYASAKEAAIAIAKMPEWLRALGVYPRQYSALH